MGIEILLSPVVMLIFTFSICFLIGVQLLVFRSFGAFVNVSRVGFGYLGVLISTFIFSVCSVFPDFKSSFQLALMGSYLSVFFATVFILPWVFVLYKKLILSTGRMVITCFCVSFLLSVFLQFFSHEIGPFVFEIKWFQMLWQRWFIPFFFFGVTSSAFAVGYCWQFDERSGPEKLNN